ncbi:class I SAM-dependent methyltransferase [Candidatus Bathyarchaeota archaeon]|nr:class I SAM-dependent methyltransferase [Candidatus Bathyarchaeota archaeon]
MSVLEKDACTKFIKEFLKDMPEEKIVTSATLSIFKDSPELAAKILLFLNENLKDRSRLLDLGCGYGYLTILFKNVLGFKEAYGIDIDDERLEESEKMGIFTHHLDLERDPLPFPNNYFDMVTAAGILNHLKFWDNLLSEANRVLKPGGLFFISDPNMGWWINRISLLLGYQPPNVEVSKIYTVNLPPFYPRKKSIEYIHSLTLKGMIEILSAYNFKCLKVFPTGIPKRDLDLKKPPIPRAIKYLIRAIDYLMCRFPSLSLRLIIVSEKI